MKNQLEQLQKSHTRRLNIQKEQLTSDFNRQLKAGIEAKQ